MIIKVYIIVLFIQDLAIIIYFIYLVNGMLNLGDIFQVS